jgi:low affinity Fe/Cu permease
MSTMLIALPWVYIFIEIGRFVGPYPSLILTSLIIMGVSTCSPVVSYKTLAKLKKNTTKWIITTNLIIALIIALLIFLLFTQRILEAHQKIETFVIQNNKLEFHEYVTAVCSFLDSNVKNAYKKPEAHFKIDEYIYSISLGKYVTQQLGFTRADIIVYQGWGTCGQAAILIEELLARAGYETRQAWFKNIDHAWAEVKYNGTWLIIDPWYIGVLKEAQNLKNLRPEFQNATGVIVQYLDGTTNDASQEHGY